MRITAKRIGAASMALGAAGSLASAAALASAAPAQAASRPAGNCVVADQAAPAAQVGSDISMVVSPMNCV
ncbi:hypothetical protein [Kitasatospora sp. HPMI-4]|uniref:hypothetical protein n=1 Tax=Kitasatospora sp. HPMI-4 TaxID=3448443 RepID=UPI003F1A0B5F